MFAISRLKYDAEDQDDVENKSLNSGTVIHYEMPNKTYYLNLVVQCIMWSAASFSFYLVQFMTKYYEGGLYLNYYLDGGAGLVGMLIAQPLYNLVKIRWSFLISLFFTLLFITLLFIF